MKNFVSLSYEPVYFVEITFYVWIFCLKKKTQHNTVMTLPVIEEMDFISEDPVTLLLWYKIAFVFGRVEGSSNRKNRSGARYRPSY